MHDLPDPEFRTEIRTWIEANYPAHMRFPRRRLHWHENRPWYLALAAKGWLAPHWPVEWGGMGLGAAKQLIMLEELERHGCARISDMGVAMLGPMLLRYGSDAQKRRFLPPILSGEHIWCQGYSEPNAGSDLAAVRLAAVDAGDHWVLDGQKTWVTFANDANWIFVLARTNPAARKQAGISFLLLPLDSPGITIRPILNLDRHDEFCEIFFDAVRVPKDMIVGQVDHGWTYAKALLGFERIAIGSPKLSATGLDRLRLLAARMGIADAPDVQALLTGFEMELGDLKDLYERFVAQVKRGEPLGPDIAILKIVQSELFQRITDAGLALAGDNAGLLDPMEDGLHPAGQFLLARPGTIFGGSSEILRNVLARTVLDLPIMTALAGLKILDMSRVFAGPWAAQILADFGADVVKIEHPHGGDDVRHMGFPMRDQDGVPVGDTSSFMAMNRGKRSITVDISEPDGQAVVQALAAGADVLVENFKTGGLARYGLDYPTLSAANPRLVYCSITGFGQTGPYAALPGYDPLFQAMSGLMSITGTADGQPGAGPALVGYSVSDINAGFYAALAIMAALRHRDQVSGRGQHIDLALLDAQVAAQSHIAMNWMVSGRVPVRNGTASQINTPWQAFDTADRPLMVAVGNDRQFRALCGVLGLATIPEDPRYATNPARMANTETLLPRLAEALRVRTAEGWMDLLNAAGVPSGPLNDFAAMAADPQIVHRGMLRTMEDPELGEVPYVANPVRFSATPIEYTRAPPRLGAHTAEVLRDWLGIE